MYSLNRATVLGNATREAELRTTPNGRSVANFAVATNRRWTDQSSGEQREEVQFHEMVTWGKLAEIASQIIRKGTKVYVEGRLQTRNWEGQDGARRERTEIIVENLIVLTPKGAAPVSDSGFDSQAEPRSTAAEPRSTATSPEKSGPTAPRLKDTPKKKGEEKPAASEDEINLDEIPF